MRLEVECEEVLSEKGQEMPSVIRTGQPHAQQTVRCASWGYGLLPVAEPVVEHVTPCA